LAAGTHLRPTELKMSHRRFMCGFDVHGDQQDKKSNRVFFDFLKIWKPDIRIAGGDVWDMRPLRKKATDDEKRESMQKDFEAGKQWLEDFQPNFFLRGNHDERLWELRESDCGVRSDYAGKLINEEIEPLMKKLRCRMLPYHKRHGVLKIGHLKVLHGFYCGMFAAKQHALAYGSCLHGHVHVIDEHSIPGLERRVGRSCGSLCKNDMSYNERQPNTLRQANGFVFGIISDKTGDYSAFQAESIGGKWMLPSDIVEL
jgi:hypothetical protein